MKKYCKYHPVEPSTWSCDYCDIEFCADCVSMNVQRRGSAPLAKCPLCADELEYNGVVNSAKPFWQSLPQITRYPLSLVPLLIIVLCGVTPVLVPDSGAGVVGVLVQVAVYGLCIKYAYSIIDYTVLGDMEPPGLKIALQVSGFEFVFKQFAVIGFMAGVTYLAYEYLPLGLPTLVVIFLIITFPASVIVLIVDSSVAEAMNPQRLLDVVRSVGWSYLLLCCILLLSMFLVSCFVGLFSGQLPKGMFEFLVGGTLCYYTFMVFHLIGYVLFQYQTELGHTADFKSVRSREGANINKVDPYSVKVDIFLKEGRYKEVISLLKLEMKRSNGTATSHEQYYKLMLAMDDQRSLLGHADEYLQLELNLGRVIKVKELLLSYIAIDPEYRPKDSELSFRIAKRLFGLGHYREVFHLLHQIHLRDPNFENTAEAYLLLMHALGDGLKSLDKATNYVNYIVKVYPDTPQAEKAQAYLESF